MALAPAQLQGAAPGVVTTCGTGGELRIIGHRGCVVEELLSRKYLRGY